MELRLAFGAPIILLTLLPIRGCGPKAPYVEPPRLFDLRIRGKDLFNAGKYAEAARVYEEGAQAAGALGDTRSAIRFLNNLGSANQRLLQPREAARAYLQARTMATRENDREMIAATSLNLSSVYLQLGEVESAREASERGLAVPAAASVKFRSQLLVQLALIRLRAEECDPATALLREAIDAAPDDPTESQAWNELGNALFECRDPRGAERALLQSYRMRKLSRDPRLAFSYESLATLRLAENDAAGAVTLLDRAIEEGGALWRPLWERGRAHLALGQADAAYRDFRESLRHLKNWRAGVLPADSFRIASEVEFHRFYADFIETAAARYRETGQKRFAEEAFEAAEDGRAASLRALWAGSDQTRRLGEDYLTALRELHGAEAEEMRGESDGRQTARLRARLAEIEAAAGLELPPVPEAGDASPGRLVESARAAIGPDEIYIAFHSGEAGTAVWAVTREAFEMGTAPAEPELQRRTREFVDAVRGSNPQAAELGRQLYSNLFGKLSERVLRKSRWTVAPDGPLFELPFGALPESGRYLIERHSVRIATGVSSLLHPAAQGWKDVFVGVGDPIYNAADPRRARGGPTKGARLELPRLLGSGREVEACANVWRSHGREAVLLEGAGASKDKLAQAVAGRPMVVHVAGHMLFPEKGGGRGMLALSMQATNEVELLSDTEVAGMPANVGLVVLNGCSSGRAEVLPGAGLMGMTRAWLAAGARAVIATRWAAPDQDSGLVFEALYREHLAGRGGERFGDLLRQAQLAELRAGGTRADPARWASYFCVERN